MIGVLANAGSLIVPFFLTILSHTRNLTEAQGGLFAMAEFGGIGVGAMGCAVLPGLVQRLNWRRAAALGLVAVIVGNLAMSAPVGFVGLFSLGLAAGVGAGGGEQGGAAPFFAAPVGQVRGGVSPALNRGGRLCGRICFFPLV